MSYKADVYKIFIASPSDTVEERAAVSKVINEWNIIHSENQGIILRDIFAEQNAYADSGKHPQKIINEQLVENSDLLVAIFKMKFGSPTDTHESGTAEEIDLAFKMKKHVMLFFCDGDMPIKEYPQHSADIQKINELKAKYSNKTYYQTYKSFEDFESKFSINLSKFINDYFIPSVKESQDKSKQAHDTHNIDITVDYSTFSNGLDSHKDTDELQKIIDSPQTFHIEIYKHTYKETYDRYTDKVKTQLREKYASEDKSLIDIFPFIAKDANAIKTRDLLSFNNSIIRSVIGRHKTSTNGLFIDNDIARDIVGEMMMQGLLKRDEQNMFVITDLGYRLYKKITELSNS